MELILTFDISNSEELDNIIHVKKSMLEVISLLDIERYTYKLVAGFLDTVNIDRNFSDLLTLLISKQFKH